MRIWEWLRSAPAKIMNIGSSCITATLRFRYTGYEKENQTMQPSIQDTITIERMIFTNNSTIGELRVDGDLFCYTLEDTCRQLGVKIPGKTAIPAGKYEAIVKFSPRRGFDVPWLLNVPEFEDIQIHVGNTADDTEGCILVGMRKGEDMIYDSKKAFSLLMPVVKDRLSKGKLYISIIGGNHVATA